MAIALWAPLEPTLGGYNWTGIDQIRNYIATKYPGKRFALEIWPTNFLSTSPSDTVPAYILADPTYGPGYDSSQHGYWQLGNYGCVASWWMPVVEARLEALFANLAAHAWAGSGNTGNWTYDTDPYMEDVSFTESALDLVSLPSNYGSNSALLNDAQTQWIKLHKSMVGSFPDTEVLAQDNFWPYAGPNSSIATVNAVTAGRVAISSPDTYAVGNFQWGPNAYLGGTAGSTPQYSNVPFVAQVQWPDYQVGNSLATIFNAAIGSPPNGLGAGKIYWADNYQWNSGINVLDFINNNAIPSANQSCPSSYLRLQAACLSN
jgi:hypothetical protein